MPVDRKQLARLAAWLPRLEQPGFDFGHWAGGDRQPDGAITMPYFAFGPDARELLRDMPVVVFDWSAWAGTEEARALREDHSRIADATPEQLVKLTTTLVRADRFSEGTLAWAFESGLLLAIVRRATVLAAS